METITEALTRKIFNSLTFNFFSMHTTQSILYILYSTHYYVIILKHGSLYKFWASETCIPQENQIKLNLIILVNQMFYRGIHMFTTILANERMGSLWMQHGSQVLEIGFTLQVLVVCFYRNLRGNLNEGFLLKVPQKLNFAK